MTAGSLSDLGPATGGARGARRWRMRYRGVSRNVTGTPAEARKALAALVADVEAGRRRTTKGTVLDALNAYVAEADLAPKTAVETERIIRLHLAPLHDVRLAALTPAQINAVYRDLGKTRAPATVRRTHVVLHAALERAVRLDLIQTNPAARVRLPTQTKQAPAVDTASVLRLLDASKRSPILHAFVVTAAATGCRRGELAALRWGDVDLAAGRVRVARALSYLGAGGLVEKPPKSGKARTVALEPAAVEVLRTWRQTQRDVGAPVPIDGGWVFSHDGVEPWGPIAAETAWRRLCHAEGVHLRLHALRHWRASAGLEAGESVAEVAATLGHSSPHVTLSTYSHVLTSTGRSVLGDAMRGARTREG